MDAGSNSIRLSLEWSRIVPRRGEVDQSAVDHYHQIFDALDKCDPFTLLLPPGAAQTRVPPTSAPLRRHP